MNYIHPILLSDHWIDIVSMVEENYYTEEYRDDLIVIGHCVFNSIDNIKKEYSLYNKYIVYQLEPLSEDHWHSPEKIIENIKNADEIWDYDLDNIEYLKSKGIEAKYKPFVYTEKLKRIQNSENPDIDVLFYGTLVERRAKIISNITQNGLAGKKFVYLSQSDGQDLDEYISRSKIILDLHTDENKTQKQSRIYYSLINNKCVVSEKSKRNYFGDLITECDHQDLIITLHYLLDNDRWKDYSNVSEKFKLKSKESYKTNLSNMIKNDRLKKIQEIKTAWTDHIYFAEWLVKKVNPDVIVDLGVDYGYSTFCFALPEIGHVYGIDSFDGDDHTGIRNTFDYVNSIKDELNFTNLSFIKGYFDDIAKKWNKKIDILHIDGFHTYEAVKNDYETWSKFVSEDGVILFHDTAVEDRNFGVKKFFDELDLYKVNFDSSFGLGVASKNKELIEEISKVFNLNLHVPKNDKIAIFYHLYQTNDWQKLYKEQIDSLITSGLYDKCDFIHVGINGTQELPFISEKVQIEYHEDKVLEANTLKSMWNFCNSHPDYKILYLHSKGITWQNNPVFSITTTSWRKYLEYFVIENWKTCIQDLSSYDCVGTEWVCESKLWNFEENRDEVQNNPHYNGNFWWANANYIRTLDINYIFNLEKNWTRWRSEFWIGTNNPKHKSYHNSQKNLYEFNYTPNYYTTDFESMIPKVFIITPCKRPLNLQTISQSIPENCDWIVVLDGNVKNEYNIENGTIIKSPYKNSFRGYSNKNFGLEYIKNNLNPSDNDWVYILHDDNIIHPNWYDNVKEHLNSSDSLITWGQCFHDQTPRIQPIDTPKVDCIDTSQYMVRWSVAKNLRFKDTYEADGIYAEEASKQGTVKKLDQYFGYYNYLRFHKTRQETRTSICMISMFKNESKGIRRMLESVWKHIDFYVFQDNGSTDGTPDIVREFFADKNIPGVIYKVEEGWINFGWNRDHLLQTTLRNDHGCDWIMKMDCDEYLEVDDDFDWSPFYNTNTESFHVTAQNPGCIYYRAWIWNANLPWKFQHDPAHEIIYLDNERGENFERFNLPRGLRMIGTNDGESYTVPTKYISDALKLEEQMIREGTMLTDTYHFWYIAKSYYDCFGANFYPLGEEHSKEFARRFIFYFEEYLKYVKAEGVHEMSYFSAFSIGVGYKYLGDIEKAISWFNKAERYCPVRNEHIVYLAQTYDELGQYDKMLEQTKRLVHPDRKLPFPDYYFIIDTNFYHDSGTYPQQLHNYALSKVSAEKNINSFSINVSSKPRLWIVDDFYNDPHAVREFALKQEFITDLNYFKGSRSKQQFIVPGTKEAFEKIIGKKITRWTETHGMCGRFQYCTAEDDLVYHCDSQTLAGMIYLTPDAPFSCGTSLFAHKKTGLRNENDFGNTDVFSETGFYDRTKFELVDTAGNVFNRLVIFDAKCIHSANEYFGTDITNSRLFHLFFFD